MPPEITARLRERGIEVEETADLETAMGEADALYMTRIQKERFEDPAEYERLKGSYVLTRDMVERSPIKPHWVVRDLDDLAARWEAALIV